MPDHGEGGHGSDNEEIIDMDLGLDPQALDRGSITRMAEEEKFNKALLDPHPGRHRTYYWVKVEEQHEQDHIPVEEVVSKHGVPQHVLMHHIQEEINEEAAVKSLPSALILVVLYALMSLAHDTQAAVRSVEEAMTFDITENGNFAFSGNMGFKSRQDVNSYADFWSWMNKGMVNLFFLDDRWVSEDSGLDLGKYTESEKQYYLNFNKKVAPLKLMQEEVGVAMCDNADMSAKFSMHCNKDKQLDLTLDPTAFDIAQIAFSEAKNSTTFLWPDSYKAELRRLEAEGWVNERTYRVVVSMLTYNANVDLLTMTNVHFMFARSGHIWKEITNRSFKLKQYDSWEVYLWDILFYLHITYLCATELHELYVIGRRRRWRLKSWFVHYIGFWNCVDWISILYAYVMLIVWLARYFKVQSLADEMLAHPGKIQACALQPDPRGCQTEVYYGFYESAEIAGLWIKDSNLLGAFYPLIIMLRLFKAFSAQPRLALVALTLKNSAGNLAHFAIVFLAAFFSFVFTGIALFGQEIAAFAQFDRCTMTLFRMLMGDFDYAALAANDRILAALFVGIFQIAMFLVLLNMLVAIVMDDYSTTKGNLTHGETLWEEVWQICERAYQNYKGTRIPLGQIFRKLLLARGTSVLKSTQVLTKEAFMKDAPGMPDSQAEDLLRAAAEEWGEVHRSEVSMNQLLSSASVAASCARATRSAIKRKRLASNSSIPSRASDVLPTATGMSEAQFSTRGMSEAQLSTKGMSEAQLSTKGSPRNSPRGPSVEELAADERVSVLDILKAAELRLQEEQSDFSDPAQVRALTSIIQSLQLLARPAGGGPEARGHGASV